MIKKTKKQNLWVIPPKKSKNSKSSLGIHLVADFWFGRIIEDEAVKKAKNTPLEIAVHKFQPQGLTGIVLLAESHIALHTWPEMNYIAIDIYTCGNQSRPRLALDFLKKKFQPKKFQIREIARGEKIYETETKK